MTTSHVRRRRAFCSIYGLKVCLTSMFEPRTYRKLAEHTGLVSFRVCVAETDLQIAADCDLSAMALAAVKSARAAIEAEIDRDRRFLTSLEPLPLPHSSTGVVRPGVVRSMYIAANKAGVGPMAAVAGAVAEIVGEAVLGKSRQVIVENGGDIFLKTKTDRVIGVQAGSSPLSGRVGLLIPGGSRLGICTSSATVGHSLSLGRADAGMIICDDTALADAYATTLANQVKRPEDVQAAVEWAQTVPEIRAALVIIGDTMGACGEYELVPVSLTG